MKNILISLQNLKQFLSELKTWVKDYFSSHVDSELSSTSENPVQNKVVTDRFSKVVWQGKEENVSAAIERGDIIPGFTQVILESGEEEMWCECTMQDIYDLFGLTYIAS